MEAVIDIDAIERARDELVGLLPRGAAADMKAKAIAAGMGDNLPTKRQAMADELKKRLTWPQGPDGRPMAPPPGAETVTVPASSAKALPSAPPPAGAVGPVPPVPAEVPDPNELHSFLGKLADTLEKVANKVETVGARVDGLAQQVATISRGGATSTTTATPSGKPATPLTPESVRPADRVGIATGQATTVQGQPTARATGINDAKTAMTGHASWATPAGMAAPPPEALGPRPHTFPAQGEAFTATSSGPGPSAGLPPLAASGVSPDAVTVISQLQTGADYIRRAAQHAARLPEGHAGRTALLNSMPSMLEQIARIGQLFQP